MIYVDKKGKIREGLRKMKKKLYEEFKEKKELFNDDVKVSELESMF